MFVWCMCVYACVCVWQKTSEVRAELPLAFDLFNVRLLPLRGVRGEVCWTLDVCMCLHRLGPVGHYVCPFGRGFIEVRFFDGFCGRFLGRFGSQSGANIDEQSKEIIKKALAGASPMF